MGEPVAEFVMVWMAERSSPAPPVVGLEFSMADPAGELVGRLVGGPELVVEEAVSLRLPAWPE
jgi:hypothetical protein